MMVGGNINISNYYNMIQIKQALNQFMEEIKIAKSEVNSQIIASLLSLDIGKNVDITI